MSATSAAAHSHEYWSLARCPCCDVSIPRAWRVHGIRGWRSCLSARSHRCLTANRMAARDVAIPGHAVHVTGPSAMPDRSRFAEYRDRLRGGPPRVPQPCGTYAAARRHRRAGEPLDEACAEAERVRNNTMYQRRKNR